LALVRNDGPLIFSIPPIAIALGYVTYPVPDVQDWVNYPILVGLVALAMAEIVWRVWTSVISRQESILSARPKKIHRAILTSVLTIPAFMYAHNRLDNPHRLGEMSPVPTSPTAARPGGAQGSLSENYFLEVKRKDLPAPDEAGTVRV